MKKLYLTFFILFVLFGKLYAQKNNSWQFAHVSDIHIGNETSIEDLRRTVKDINANPNLQFVVLSGDITEFGADTELKTAKRILDSLNKPWYIIPGNHDMNWSESGGNSFRRVFGSETFAFKHNGYLFLGTNCGPNMRMGPGQIPRENLVWLDSVLKVTPATTPVIFVNHYPIDSALNNWYEIINRLKTHNIQLVICGHGHSNHHLNFEGIPGVMGRSNLRAKDSIGGYNIVTIAHDSVYYNERTPGVVTKPTWTKDALYNHHFTHQTITYKRPDFHVNQQFKNVKVVWSRQDDSDIGSGGAIAGDAVVMGNTNGWIKAYYIANGKQKWAAKAGGKIYSTPCVSGNFVLIACSDKFLYCLDKNTGDIKWRAEQQKPVVTSPVVNNSMVYCGGSDGHFRCYELSTGKLIWDYPQVQGFVVTRPLLYNGLIYFGSWGNHLYALNQKTGAAAWTWTSGATNRMFSPAACEPVATKNRLFIVAPDRYMTCLNAVNGQVIWRHKGDDNTRVREAMGLSVDSSLVYVKTMNGDILGMSAKTDSMQVDWRGARNMGYEISPSVVKERAGLVFGLQNSGDIYAFNRKDGSLAWVHKISNALVNPVTFVNDHELIATTMDGKIVCLKY